MLMMLASPEAERQRVSHHKLPVAWLLLWAESSLLVEPAMEMQMSRDDLAKGSGGKEPSEALDRMCPV